MRIIGITGGSGAGKSTVAKIFESMGAEVADADEIYRRVTGKGSASLCEIKKVWPEAVKNGELDRKVLAAIVFNSEAELHKLNSITHKYVIDEIKAMIEKSTAEIFVIDAIALFESGLFRLCHKTLAVVAQKGTRVARIMARDGLAESEALMRINAQKSDTFFTENADYTIENDINQQHTEEQIGWILGELV